MTHLEEKQDYRKYMNCIERDNHLYFGLIWPYPSCEAGKLLNDSKMTLGLVNEMGFREENSTVTSASATVRYLLFNFCLLH